MNKRYRSDSAILIVGTVCAAIGLLTLLGLVIQINLWTEFKKTGVPVTAEITQIEARRSGTSRHRRTVHDVYIRYTYNGTVYENELDYYSLGMSKGQTVDILIDPSSPQRIKSSPVPVVSIAVTSLFFLIFFGVGGGFLGNEIRKSIIINNLISTDRYIICQD